MPDRILIVDDEESVRELLTSWLEDAGYETSAASNGDEGLRMVYERRPDLVVIDILMPGMDGYELCQLVKKMCDASVMILSALDQVPHKVRGLDLGADDYVVKPIGMSVFLARVTALLRRGQISGRLPNGRGRYADSVLKIDRERHEVSVENREVELTPTEYGLLNFLTDRAGEACAISEIVNGVWGSPLYSSDVVRWHISSLRKKINVESNGAPLIKTIRGQGYRYEVPES